MWTPELAKTLFKDEMKITSPYLISGTPAGSETTGVYAGVICLFSEFSLLFKAFSLAPVFFKEADTS